MELNNRRKKIVELIKSKNSIRLETLVNFFNVSKMTLYRDLKSLDDKFFISKGTVYYKSGDSFIEAHFYF